MAEGASKYLFLQKVKPFRCWLASRLASSPPPGAAPQDLWGELSEITGLTL
jgi:hypothetical protein